MLSKIKMFTATSSFILMAVSAPAVAAPFILNYGGVTSGTGTPFTATLNLDLASNGAIATFISGQRNGVAITGLSTYGFADNRLSFENPYVSFAGLSYTLMGGTSYNFFYDGSGTYLSPKGIPGYGEVDSVSDPSGFVNSNTITTRVTFASVNGVVVSAVPEPATWALMILGMGAVGFAMRRRQKVSTTVRFA